MKKLLLLILISLPVLAIFNFQFSVFNFQIPFEASADELDDVSKKLTDEQRRLAELEAKKQQLAKDIASASSSLAAISSQLEEAEAELASISEALAEKEEILAKWEKTRNFLIRQAYKLSRVSALEIVFSSDDFADATKKAYYHAKSIEDLKERISAISAEIVIFRQNKEQAEKLRGELADLKAQYQVALASVQRRYTSTNSQITEARVTIKDLTAKQVQLILEKIGNSLATGSLALSDDPNSRVTFNPGFSPAFAAFSFGAYTHRNGMSQYGALGRAQQGQGAEQILAAYFPGSTLNKNYPIPTYIYVHGTNEYGQTFSCQQYELNEYVKHLYEVPSSWPVAVLKAQATLARSYAIHYVNFTSKRCTDSQGERRPYICPSQSCQVVKMEINALAWQNEVNNTSNWVLTGSPTYQYSSTAGGYLNNSGWDTTSGSMSAWPDDAYENIAGSPWFYKGWYKTLDKNSCGRSHPWLTETEFADILNSWVVYTNGTTADKARVVSIDYNSCWGGSENPYSISEMKNRAEALGGSYAQVYGVAASYSSGGYTSLISLATDRGAITIDGPIFRDIFNLRAPGRIVIKTPLYNIEKK